MLNIILLIVSILLVIYSAYVLRHTHKINKATDALNKKIDNANKFLLQENRRLLDEADKIESQLQNKKDRLDDIQNALENQKELSKEAFENYCDILEQSYKDKEKEYDQYETSLIEAYSNYQLKLLDEMNVVKADLDKIKETRTAALQALTREKEIEEQLAFYCLQASDNDLKDIAVLDSVKVKLTNPRILSMLIWQTYWRTPMTNLCNNVIGKDTKTGIYKITNQKTKECYIGQAVDLASRWKDHAKCGLGIDTPAGNKLYKAIQEFGIWNFSWEVLEICPKEQLNEKEKYYIDLYDSKNFGYNSTSGNK